jgi:nucleotide-binding universal stress UspA family protein
MARAILVPLDGSAFSEQALPVAEKLACGADVVLHIVRIHVRPTHAPLSLEGMPVTDPDQDAQQWEAERAYVMRVAARLSGSGHYTRTAVLHGPVSEILDIYARLNLVDLIVMSTHGRSGLARAWMGSVADALVRSSRIPVLLVRPVKDGAPAAPSPGTPRILIALDGSRLAEEVMEPALELGRALDADFTLVRVVNPLGLAGDLSAVLPPAMVKAVAAQHEAEASSYLTEIAWWLRDRGLRVETRVLMSESPADAILTDAVRHRADFLAMATHGRSGLPRLLMGSVAGRVLSGSKVPLLLCRPRADAHRYRTQPAPVATASA